MGNKLGHIFLIFLWVLIGLLLMDVLWGINDLITLFTELINEIF
tara:strand:- start:734 stop:865 length:132 start_codon:yes stop_codon:yes gene_type:complete